MVHKPESAIYTLQFSLFLCHRTRLENGRKPVDIAIDCRCKYYVNVYAVFFWSSEIPYKCHLTVLNSILKSMYA